MNQLLDIKHLINDSFIFPIMIVFMKNFVTIIITFFSICASLFDSDQEIDSYVQLFVIYSFYYYIIMITVIFFNSLFKREVSF